MKTIIRRSHFIAIAFITLFFSNPMQAITPDSSTTGSRIELKVIGTYNDQSIFQLKVTGNRTQDIFSVIIRDIYGNNIYQEIIRAGNFSKKFLFNSEELGDETLQMEVYNRQTKQSVIYQIKRSYEVVRDEVISQVR